MATDTSADTDRVRCAIYRAMSPSRRAEIAAQMAADARAIALQGIRRRHPDYDDDQARMALFRLLLGDVLYRRAWPDAPLLPP